MRTGFRLILAIMLVSALMLSSMPRNAVAIPYKVQGYLLDENGVPITLANISFSGEVYDMGTQDMEQKTWYKITDANGYFVIYLAADEPGGMYLGSTLTVSYDSGEEVASTSVTIQGLSAWANLTYDEKPGIGDILLSPVGAAIFVILVTAIVIGYFVLRVEKPEEIPPEEKPRKVERRRRSK